MAKSFILKGAQGGASGFLQHTGQVLRCKAQAGEAQNAKLTLCFEDGERRALDLSSDGSETESPLEARRVILCAYVSSEGKLLLWTDERAKRAFYEDSERALRKEERARPVQPAAPPAEPVKAPSKTDCEQAQEKGGATGGESHAVESGWRMPQRRWPPPACWPRARYVSGVWTDAGQQTAISPSAR